MSNAPIHLERINRDLFVEPLGGPQHMESLLESFPEAIYDKSPSSKFYRFFYALMGPSGIGQMVKNYFEARLILLENNIELFDIERFYGDPFQFGRILEEQSFEDVNSTLLPEKWEEIKAQDASYRSRALDFVGAARLGNSPQGIRLAAKSGLGSEVSIYERYNWLFDQLSDQPIGVKNYGKTFSLNEFVVMPRPTDGQQEVQQIKFEATVSGGEYTLEFLGVRTTPISWDASSVEVQTELRRLTSIGQQGVQVTGGPAPFPIVIRFTGPLGNNSIEPIKIVNSSLYDGNGKSSNVRVETLTEGMRPIDAQSNIPERLLHNAQTAIDRLKPVNALFTFESVKGAVLNQDFQINASSTYIEPIRFVTGRTDVNWRISDDKKFWIESGIEKSAKRFYQNDSAHYTAFHSISSIQIQDEGLTNGNSMIDPMTDSRSILNGYVNGIYPIEYASISNVSNLPIQQAEADVSWQSLSRSFPNNEIIEIDLGTYHPTNFISFDIINKPSKVKVEYSVWDEGNIRNYEEVVPTDSEFSGFLEGYNEIRWEHIECQFTDANGSIPVVRYLKITVERLNNSPYNEEFSVWIKGLQVGRNLVL